MKSGMSRFQAVSSIILLKQHDGTKPHVNPACGSCQ
jgi:hypothetical protein